jgi:hypothetical protein
MTTTNRLSGKIMKSRLRCFSPATTLIVEECLDACIFKAKLVYRDDVLVP